eukprot:4234208-Prymnesium_polylepis.1
MACRQTANANGWRATWRVHTAPVGHVASGESLAPNIFLGLVALLVAKSLERFTSSSSDVEEA